MEFPWINEAIAAVPENFAPEFPPVGENTVVGTVPEHLRPLVLAFAHTGETALEKIKAHREEGHDEEKCALFHREVERLVRSRNTLKNLFYTTLEIELGLDPGETYGICADWQVIAVKKEEKELSLTSDIIVIGMSGFNPGDGEGHESIAEHLSRTFGV